MQLIICLKICFPRLTGCYTHQWSTHTTTVSYRARCAKMETQWMCWSWCRSACLLAVCFIIYIYLTYLLLMMYVMFKPMRLFANWLTTEQEPVIPGCFLRARAIGLMPMIDQAWSILQIFHSNFHISHYVGLMVYLFVQRLGWERW